MFGNFRFCFSFTHQCNKGRRTYNVSALHMYSSSTWGESIVCMASHSSYLSIGPIWQICPFIKNSVRIFSLLIADMFDHLFKNSSAWKKMTLGNFTLVPLSFFNQSALSLNIVECLKKKHSKQTITVIFLVWSFDLTVVVFVTYIYSMLSPTVLCWVIVPVLFVTLFPVE